jgi:predicted permease
MLRAPQANALVLAVLSIAVAANVTLFSVLDAALFRGVALPDSDRLANIYSVGARGAGDGGLALPDFRDLAAALESSPEARAELFGFSGLMAAAAVDNAAPEVVFGELVTANYFSASRAPLALGGGFADEDDQAGAPPRAVLGYRFWQRRFNGDPDVVGRAIRLNGLAFTIVGVADERFPGLLFSGLAADVFAPLSALTRFRNDVRENRAERWLFTKARLAPGAELPRLRATLDVVAARLQQTYQATNKERTFRAVAADDVMINPEADRAVKPLALAVMVLGLLVLAIASANVASVLAARAASRGRELAVRVSLGATRPQLISLLAVEALLLGGTALVCGLGVAAAALSWVRSFRPSLPVPLGWTVAIDTRVVLFAVAAMLGTTLAVMLIPAWRASRLDPIATLKGNDRGSRFGRERLLVPQVACSLVLLVVAGLFTRSLQGATRLQTGFSTINTATISINAGLSGYDDVRAAAFWRALLESVRAQPGVQAAAVTDRIPLDLYGSQSAEFSSDHVTQPESMQAAHVGAEYFSTLGIPIQQGRAFTDAEQTPESRVAIVSQSAAAHLWPGRSAIGERVRVGADGNWHRVIGIVGDVQLLETLGEVDAPLVYLPVRSGYSGLLRIVGRSSGQGSLTELLAKSARAIDPNIAVFETETLEAHVGTLLLPYRAAALVAAAAGLFGLLLTMAGTAASVAQALATRMRELGIRIALGAPRLAIVRAIAVRVSVATALGLAVGACISVPAALGLGGVLFGMSPLDPVTFILVPLFVLAAVCLAIGPSLRRVLRLDAPAILRQD